jgi:hypothetical protein
MADVRHDYGELREIGYGLIGDRWAMRFLPLLEKVFRAAEPKRVNKVGGSVADDQERRFQKRPYNSCPPLP